MTLLNWELTPTSVTLISDTLALDGFDKRPIAMKTKVMVLPHLAGLIAGTGYTALVGTFWSRVCDSMVLRDIEHLDEFATDVLTEIWASVADRLPQGTTTIYTFGVNSDGEVTGYAYRSANGWESEALPYAYGIKPALELPADFEVDGVGGLLALAKSQQEQDRARPRMERVGIGGDLWIYRLSTGENGPIISMIRAERMDHFENDWEIVLSKLPQNEDHPYSRMILAKDP